MQILIEAPKFSNIYDTSTGRIGRQIAFMKNWPIEDIKDYCNKKGWKFTVIQEDPQPNEDVIYYGYDD